MHTNIIYRKKNILISFIRKYNLIFTFKNLLRCYFVSVAKKLKKKICFARKAKLTKGNMLK